MSSITVDVSGLTGKITVDIPENGTLADVREQASVPSNVGFAAGGQRVEDSYSPSNGERVSTLPPEVKAG